MKAHQVTEEMVLDVEHRIGMGSGAWDVIPPREIIAASIAIWEQDQLATLTQQAASLAEERDVFKNRLDELWGDIAVCHAALGYQTLPNTAALIEQCEEKSSQLAAANAELEALKSQQLNHQTTQTALLEACQEVKAKLDYLCNLWGAEGVARSVIQKLEEALAKATT